MNIVDVARVTMTSYGNIFMERNTTLVGRGSGMPHSFEQSRLLSWTAGALGLTIAEPSCVLPGARSDKREGGRPRAPRTGL